jgi:hypothetical protein
MQTKLLSDKQMKLNISASSGAKMIKIRLEITSQ